MGDMIGSALTAGKRKKISRQMKREYTIQADMAKEGQRIGQLQANYAATQEKLQQLREGRIRRAQLIAAGVNAGGGQSSSLEGGASSAYTSAIGNVANLGALQTYSEGISKTNQELAASQGRSQVLGVKMETQQQKAKMIGGIFNTVLSVASMGWGGAGGAMLGSMRGA